MAKIIRLTERDITKLIRNVIQEQEHQNFLVNPEVTPQTCVPDDSRLRKVYDMAVRDGFKCTSKTGNEIVLVGKENQSITLVANVSKPRK